MKLQKGRATKKSLVSGRVPTLSRRRYHASGATFGGIFENALQALWSHRQRSILTMFGIMIGIAAFISIVAVSQGVSASFESRFSFTTTIISVNPSAGVTKGIPFNLTSGDIDALATLPYVINSSPMIGNKAEIIYGDQVWKTTLQGVSSEYQAMYGPNVPMGLGTWWSTNEDQSKRFVAVLGSTVAKNIFPAGNAIGQTIRIDHQLYHVIGLLQSTGSSGLDDVVYVPYTVMFNPLLADQIQSVSIQADSINNLDQLQAEMKARLELRHHISPPTPDGFDLVESLAQVQQYEQSVALLTGLMVSISVLALIVGGVGIMNIMLISITERTREIGLRAALGAQPRDICMQFLLEALVLSLMGGALGILVGLLLAYGITTMISAPFILNVFSFSLGFGVAGSVGIIFGLYPAIRASRLDPIIALRSS